MTSNAVCVAGVDGCPGGWIAVFRYVGLEKAPAARVFKNFADVISADESPEVIAVDMPIGLPDRVEKGGRGPDSEIRKFLGDRQSSVFSVPARQAVYCEDYSHACEIALQTSDPPKKVSRQCFGLFPKIREIDSLMTEDLESRVYEVHPEFAFWRINNESPMSLPKKVKSRPNEPGLEQRKDRLIKYGFTENFFTKNKLPKVGADDLIDAAVNSVVAERIYFGQAKPYPENYGRDANGLRIAIWS